MPKNPIFLVLSALVLLTILSSSALAINLFKHYNIQVTDGAGNPQTGTFTFQFDFTNNQDCTGVVQTFSVIKTTDARGVVSIYAPSSGIDFSVQKYLCYYRNAVLQSVVLNNETVLAPVPYADYALNVSWAGILNRPTALSFFTNDIGVNASFNQSLTDLLYSPIKWAYNQTYTGGTFNATYAMFAYNQTYSGSTFNSTYAQFAYNQTVTPIDKQTICWSTTNSVGTSRFLGMGGILNKAGRGWRPARNGSILSMTTMASGADPGGVWVAGTAPNITITLNVSQTNIYSNYLRLLVQTNVYTGVNSSPYGTKTFTPQDNVTVFVSTDNTATFLVASYCVEFAYDN